MYKVYASYESVNNVCVIQASTNGATMGCSHSKAPVTQRAMGCGQKNFKLV